jgi:hypothetical protein
MEGSLVVTHGTMAMDDERAAANCAEVESELILRVTSVGCISATHPRCFFRRGNASESKADMCTEGTELERGTFELRLCRL